MKPPPRQRVVPGRFQPKQTAPKPQPTVPKGWHGWHRSELRHLLSGLKKQSKNIEINIEALKEKLPNRSVEEISNFFKFLKNCVGKRVARQIKKQEREELNDKVPIQVWEELARDMAGSLEEAISYAFSQMLTICATEPSTIHNVVSFSQNEVSSSLLVSNQTPAASDTSQQHSEQSAAVAPSGSSVAAVVHPTTVEPISTVATPSVASVSPASRCQRSASNSKRKRTPSVAQTNTPEASSSQTPQDASQKKPLRPAEYVVNIDSIYRYLSALSKNMKPPMLSCMESAVVLDLLLSLPDEIMLLDCKELQRHMCQVYTRLTAPAEEPLKQNRQASSAAAAAAAYDSFATGVEQTPETATCKKDGGAFASPAAGETSVSVPSNNADPQLPTAGGSHSAGCVSDVGSGSEATSSATKPLQKPDWATAGLCPLNPFMIPINLLARKESVQQPSGSQL